jgi:hypothetical protein
MKNFGFSNNTEEYIYKEDVRGRGDHVWNKFLLSIDGWSATWGRIPWMLYSNCVLVKQKSTTVQWFYSEMIEGEHYIEIPENFEMPKFKEWALVND